MASWNVKIRSAKMLVTVDSGCMVNELVGSLEVLL